MERPPHSAHSFPPKSMPDTSRALAIGAILLVMVGIVGILAYTKLSQPPARDDPVFKPVEIKLVVDAQCKYCPQTNTILAKLDEGGVQYSLQTIDIESEKGKALVEEFEIEYAPTALVSIIGLDQNATIQAALQGQFIKEPLKTKKGWVIVPEKFLDKQPKLLTFVKPPSSTCEVPPGKILITAQLDYGDCKPCIEAQKILNYITQKYDPVMVEYVPIMYQRTTLKAINAALTTNKGAVCAEKLGYLDDYTECNYFNAQFHGNLDINFMKSCLVEAGGSSKETKDEFVSCIQDENSGAEQTLIQNTKTMHLWNPIKFTPSFIIDCNYSFVGQKSIESYLCSFHPELEGCTTTPPIPDSNASITPDGNTAISPLPK